MPIRQYIFTFQRRKGEAFPFPDPPRNKQQAADNPDSIVIHAEDNTTARKVAEEYFRFKYEQENPGSIEAGRWRKAQVAIIEEDSLSELLPAPTQR